MKRRLCLALAFAASVALADGPTTYYVDDDRPNDSGDGLSWETAKRTIQAAVDLAEQGDTVLVAPGTYDEGYGAPASAPESNYKSRVYIDKGITLKADKGAGVTFIVGARDGATVGETGRDGNGPNAVRCVYVNHNSSQTTVVEGFTLRDGAGHAITERDGNAYANGGGFRVGNNAPAYLVDCVVENCTGVRGGAMASGRAVRTAFRNNTCVVKGAVETYSQLYFCVATGNKAPNAGLLVGGTHVNCTYVNNPVAGTVFTEAAKVYNTLAVQNAGGMSSYEQKEEYYHSVLTPKNAHFDACTKDAETVGGGSIVQFFAPLVGDLRLVTGADAVNRASKDFLSQIDIPDGVERYVDVNGRSFDPDQPFHAGAIQEVVEPGSGMLMFNDARISVDGVAAQGMPNYVFASSYPTQFLVRPLLDGGRVFSWYARTAAGNRWRFPLPDDSLWFMPPAKGDGITNELYLAANVYYVSSGGSADGVGTQANPFNTIQKACDAVPTDNTRCLVLVGPGEYDTEEGLKVHQGMTNRVSIVSGQYVRIVGAGEGATFIRGKSDLNGPAGDGSGPAAIRCVSASSAVVAIQNLTLADGRTDDTSNSADVPQTRGGGAAFGNIADFHIADCTITNCVGYRGAVYSGTISRCRLTDSLGYGGGVRYSKFLCCVMDNMRTYSNNSIPFGYNGSAVQCTFIGKDKEYETLVSVDQYTNMVLVTTRGIGASLKLPGSIAWNVRDNVSSDSLATVADPQLTRMAQGDFIPLATSPAVAAGILYDGYAYDYTPDREGNPIRFVDGRPCAGAFQTFRSGYAVDASAGLNGVVLGGPAYAELADDESATVSFDISFATRPYKGIEADGVFAEGATQVTIDGSAQGESPFAIVVRPVFDNTWYVDATDGDDGRSGFSEATAKKTFAALFATGFVAAGDVVHALPGLYDGGRMACPKQGSVESTVDARLVVPPGVTVVADRGPVETVIKGDNAPANAADEYGLGSGAVRGVFLNADSVVRGFTIRGGRTEGTGVSDGNNFGGGVYGYGNRKAFAVDCIISDNASSRGGGAHQGVYINCRFFGNRALNNRAAASNAYLYNCVVDGNFGVNATQNCYDTVNCTFGPGNKNVGGSSEENAIGLPLGPVVNCLVLGTYNANGDSPLYATNCVFLASKKKNANASYNYDDATLFAEDGRADVAEDYSPVIGSNVGVNYGRALDLASFSGLEYCPEDLRAEILKTDALGGQRVYDGTIDVGAVEADWRPRYAAAIGKRVSVDFASPGVTLEGGTVRLADGASISGVWSLPAGGRIATCAYGVSATSGTLDGQIGDVAVVAESAPVASSFRSSAESVDYAFAFSGGGYGEIVGFNATVPGFSVIVR